MTSRRSSKTGAFLVVLLVFTAQALCTASAGNNLVGINYGPVNSTSLSPTKAVALIKSLGVGRVRLFDANAQALAALANSGLDVVISLPDEEIPAIATDENAAIDWILKNVVAFFPTTRITVINVGNNILSGHPRALWVQLLPAITNLYNAVLQHNLAGLIKVTTSFSMDVVSLSFPPSSGTFRADIATQFIAPILDFLTQTQTPFFLNVYPYLAWQNNPKNVPLSFALFKAPGMPTWLDNNLSYNNLLDVQLDAVAFAMEEMGYPDIDIVISETGWPTAGGADGSLINAFMYNQGLMNKVTASQGTPYRPNRAVPAFIYTLVDEGHEELRWGVFNADGSKVYDLLPVWQSAGGPAQSPWKGPVSTGSGYDSAPAPAPDTADDDVNYDNCAPAPSPDTTDDDVAAPAPAPAPSADDDVVYDNAAPAPSPVGDVVYVSPAPSPGQSSPAARTHPLLPHCVLLILAALAGLCIA